MIHLEPITAANWQTAIDLKVRAEQEHFVAPNVYSIAESQFLHHEGDGTLWKYTPLGIYNDNDMVGFTMYCWEQTRGAQSFISRVMLDANHQGKGFGKATMQVLLAHIQASAGPNANEIVISYVPANEIARKLYAGFGFVETGEVDGEGEVLAKRPLNLAV